MTKLPKLQRSLIKFQDLMKLKECILFDSLEEKIYYQKMKLAQSDKKLYTKEDVANILSDVLK